MVRKTLSLVRLRIRRRARGTDRLAVGTVRVLVRYRFRIVGQLTHVLQSVEQKETAHRITDLADRFRVLLRDVRVLAFLDTDVVVFLQHVVAVVNRHRHINAVVFAVTQSVAVECVRGDRARGMFHLRQPVVATPRVRRDVPGRFFDRGLVAIRSQSLNCYRYLPMLSDRANTPARVMYAPLP
jgi:hypothetical protein